MDNLPNFQSTDSQHSSNSARTSRIVRNLLPSSTVHDHLRISRSTTRKLRLLSLRTHSTTIRHNPALPRLQMLPIRRAAIDLTPAPCTVSDRHLTCLLQCRACFLQTGFHRHRLIRHMDNRLRHSTHQTRRQALHLDLLRLHTALLGLTQTGILRKGPCHLNPGLIAILTIFRGRMGAQALPMILLIAKN